MTTQNPFPLKEFVLGIILIVILILLNCTNSHAQTFNYRDYQKGNFKVTYDADSIYISEQFVYEEAGYKKLWKNKWSEAITNVCDNQAYKEIFTEQNKYVLFYCKSDYHDFQICNVYIYPAIGEIIQYYNK